MNRQPSRGLVILVVSLIVLAVLGYLAYSHIRRDQKANEIVSMYDVKPIATSTLPDRFPGDLPIAAGAKITKNEVMTAPDGRFQETRAYTVNMPLAKVRDAYDAYFKDQGWTINDKKDLGSFVAYLTQRDGTSLQATLTAHGEATAVTINVTVAPATATQ